MLALDDQSLARVVIAATAVPPDERASWLEDLADRLETEAKRARHRRDSADWRARQRNGLVLLRPVVDEANFAVAAVAAGLLNPLRADDVATLTAAAKRVLDLFAAGEFSRREPGDVNNVRTRLLEAAHGAVQHGGNESSTRARDAAPAQCAGTRSRGAKAGR
jgi:hypothetical protein